MALLYSCVTSETNFKKQQNGSINTGVVLAQAQPLLLHALFQRGTASHMGHSPGRVSKKNWVREF